MVAGPNDKGAAEAAGRRALVLARAGDPPMREGRARLIWAANTASVLGELGFDSHLVCQDGLSYLPWRWWRPLQRVAPSPVLRSFYNVSGPFKLAVLRLPAFLQARGGPYLESGSFETRHYFDRFVLPQFQVVHTRDWRVASLAVRRNIPTIYEDHHESFNVATERYDEAIVSHPAFRVAVAISDHVAEVMAAKGIPAARLMVEDSGVSGASFETLSAEERGSRRERWLEGGKYQKIVAYAGGLHEFRGVGALLDAARQLPHVHVLIAGGRSRQATDWRKRALAAGVTNVTFLGYLPQASVPALLQAADALALPYQDPAVARITSPLKFFEYLCAGRPIAACALPALARHRADVRLVVEWAEVGDGPGFVEALRAALMYSGDEDGMRECHRSVARQQTWMEREKRILRAAEIPWAEAAVI